MIPNEWMPNGKISVIYSGWRRTQVQRVVLKCLKSHWVGSDLTFWSTELKLLWDWTRHCHHAFGSPDSQLCKCRSNVMHPAGLQESKTSSHECSCDCSILLHENHLSTPPSSLPAPSPLWTQCTAGHRADIPWAFDPQRSRWINGCWKEIREWESTRKS